MPPDAVAGEQEIDGQAAIFGGVGGT